MSRPLDLVATAATIMLGALALTACAPADAAPAPTVTVTVTATATAQPAPDPEETEEPGAAEMTAEEAADRCMLNYARFDGNWQGKRSWFTGEPQVHERDVLPRWLVLIPAENQNGSSFVQCLLGGDPDAETNDAVGEMSADTVTEEYIQRLVAENEQM